MKIQESDRSGIPSRQAVEVRVQASTELRQSQSVFMAALHQAVVDIVSDIVVTEAYEASRRRRALSDALGQIHREAQVSRFSMKIQKRRWRKRARRVVNDKQRIFDCWSNPGRRRGSVGDFGWKAGGNFVTQNHCSIVKFLEREDLFEGENVMT